MDHGAAAIVGRSAFDAKGDDVSGFELAKRFDFEDGAMPSEFGVYKRTADGKYDDANVSLSGERLHLLSQPEGDGSWRAAGIAVKLAEPQTFGSYRARVRLDPGTAFRGVLLLWPDGGDWPPEIDFYEIGGNDPDRVRCTQTLHYGGDNRMIHTNYALPGSDFTRWHVVRCDWTPGKLDYWCDGTKRSSVESEYVPDVAMHLCLQTGVSKDPAPAPDDTPGGLHVEWVEIHRYVA